MRSHLEKYQQTFVVIGAPAASCGRRLPPTLEERGTPLASWDARYSSGKEMAR
jgi:hypothetical protein